MSNLRDLVQQVQAIPGVDGAAVLGRDGLVIDAAGLGAADAEHLAALAPGLLTAAERLADASTAGDVRAVAVEAAARVMLAMPLSRDLALVVSLRGGAAAAAATGEALYALRRARREYAALA